MKKIDLFLMSGLLSACACVSAESIVYPADSGVLNVRTQYGAYGDGVHDDTAAIQSALAAGLNKHKIVYLPNGTYLVSSTLKWNDGTISNGGWGRFLSMQGESQSGTVIKLRNAAPGFTAASSPQAVVMTASGDDNNQYSDANGEGNQAFENSLFNLTVDVGSGNPGAVGVDYQVSNWGAMRDVTVRSSDAAHAGLIGINLQRRDNGPGLIKNVTVDGFQQGVVANQEIVQMTLENVTLRNQSVLGIYDGSAVFAVRKLHSVNSVPAVRVDGDGLLDLLDADLNGGAAASSAVQTVTPDSRAFVRNVSTTGYASAVSNRGAVVTGNYLSEWTSDGVSSAFPSPPASLNLPVRETPTYTDANLGDWQSVGPPSGSDDAAAIQRAMNAGRPVVYFPSGDYHVSRSITVPPGVRLILGMGSTLGTTTDLGGGGLFAVTGGASTDRTIIARFAESVSGAAAFVSDASPRTLILRDIGSFGGSVYRNQSGVGPLFIEDVAGAGYQLNVPQQVWARQWNAEGSGSPKVHSAGATIWALGLKSESTDTIIDAEGGKTELYGGFFYTFGNSATPTFINNNASVALSFAGTTYVGNGFYSNLVQETRGTATQTFTKNSAYGRGGGASVPLYTGYQPAATQTYRINAGGFVAVPFDGESITPSGNTGTYFTSDPIDTTGVMDPAPQSVYQSERDDLGGTGGGAFTYTFPNLTPGKPFRVRLHFAERYWTTAGSRVFNVAVNGAPVLSNFDIYAAAGAKNKAVAKEFNATANAAGQVQITFTTVKDRALVNGIEVLPFTPGGEAPPLPAAGLQLWFQADALQGLAASVGVPAWVDSSGSGYTAVGAAGQQPTWQSSVLNGDPVARFDGASQFLSLPAGLADWSQGVSAFIVTDPVSGNWFAPWFDFGNGAADDNLFLSWDHTYASGIYFATYPADNGSGTTCGGTLGQYQTLEVVMQAASPGSWTPTDMYQNGVFLNRGYNLGLSIRPRVSNLIGKSNWSSNGMFQGDIAEIILYNRALSDQERQTVEYYLQDKYDLP